MLKTPYRLVDRCLSSEHKRLLTNFSQTMLYNVDFPLRLKLIENSLVYR